MKKIILLFVIFLVIGLLFVSGCCKTVTKEVKGCDKIEGCECIHESWGGLGSCDTCKCEEGPLCNI